MLSTSSYGGYRDGTSHVTRKHIPDTLEDNLHENRQRKVGLSYVLKTSKDDSQSDVSVVLPGIPLLEVDDRIHNALLEELCADYGVTDSSDIDLLTLDLPADETRPANQYEQVVRLDSVQRRDDGKRRTDETKLREQCQRPALASLSHTTEKSYNKIDLLKAVASPTISSSCEESPTCTSVDNISAEVGMAPVQSSNSTFQSFVAEASERNVDVASPAMQCQAAIRQCKDGTTSVMKRELDWSEPKSSKSCYVTDDDYSAASCSGEVHVAKKPKIIASGGDLLEDVKKSYEFVRGAAIYSPAASLQWAATQSFWPQMVHNKQSIATSNYELLSGCDPSKGSQTNDLSHWITQNNARSIKKVEARCDGAFDNRCGSADVESNQSHVRMPVKCEFSAGWTGSGARSGQGYNTGLTDAGCHNYRSADIYTHLGNKSELQHSSARCDSSSFGPGLTDSNLSYVNNCGSSSLGPSKNFNRDEKHLMSSDNRVNYVNFQSPNRALNQDSMVQSHSFLLHNRPLEHSGIQCTYSCESQNGLLRSRYLTGQFSGACSSNQPLANVQHSVSSDTSSLSQRSSSFQPVLRRPGSANFYSANQLASSNSNAGLLRDQTVPGMHPINVYNSVIDDRRNCFDTSAMISVGQQSVGRQCTSAVGYGQNTSQRLQQYTSDDVRSTPYFSPGQNPNNVSIVPRLQDQSSRISSIDKGAYADQSCRGFVQHLVSEGSGPYQLHPLFPLLRDLVIADMNFDAPSFPFPLLAGMPKSFDRLVENYFSSNRRAPTELGVDPSIDNIIMDALRFAHSSLIDKIRCQRLKEGFQEVPRPPVDDVCAQFSQFGQQTTGQVHISNQVNHSPWSGVPASQADMNYMNTSSGFSRHVSGVNVLSVDSLNGVESDLKLFNPGDICSAPMYGHHSFRKQSQSSYDYLSSISESSDSVTGNEKANKNKVLPNEAKAIMVDWLRAHQENPYPNDDEKEELIASTKLTISQINYWFTNARRRLLPKWAMQRRHAFERDSERHLTMPIQ